MKSQWLRRFGKVLTGLVFGVVVAANLLVLLTVVSPTLLAQTPAQWIRQARPFLRLEGTEASGKTFELRENAGAFTIYNVTDNKAVASFPTTGGQGMYSVLYSALGTPSNNVFAYCSDCNKATPCTSGGGGAFAKRLNGAWDCD